MLSVHHLILAFGLVWLAFPITCAMIARAKNRSAFLAFLVGLLLPPIAVFYYLAVPKR